MRTARIGALFLRWTLCVTLGLLVFATPWTTEASSVRSGSGGDRVVADGLTTAHHPAALKKMDDCDELQLYVADVMLETLISYLYGWHWWWANPWSQPGGETDDGPSDYTTTNNQEEGVDELDIVKTNGTHIFTVADDEFIIVRSWPADESEVIARVDLGVQGQGLLLFGDLAAVVTSSWVYEADFPRYYSGTGIQVFDVGDPTQPELIRSIEVEGRLTGGRLIGGDLYAVIMSYMPIPEAAWDLIWSDDLDLPEVDWDDPEEEFLAAAEEAREILRPLILEIALELEPADILPLVKDSTAASDDPVSLFDCGDVYRPAEASEYSVLGVLNLDLDGPNGGLGEFSGTAILADGWEIYASLDRLYVAQSSRWSWWGVGKTDMTTAIHAFDLAADPETPVSYVATGEVPGWLQSQFAMSEYDGHLRVATTMTDWWWGFWDPEEEESGSVVTVLKDHGNGILGKVGQVRNIAPGEQIQASRMMGEVGYLVTFERIDPLFTLDLSDPTDPRILGELEMPGFSAYLHPVDEDHLLAVGMAGEEDGTITGLAINLFDVSDLSAPQLEYQYVVEDHQRSWSWSEALRDHHAFTYHRDVLSIPAYLWGDYEHFSGLMVFLALPEMGIWKIGQIDHRSLPPNPDWGNWWSNARMRRSIYIEDKLFSLSVRGIKVNDLNNPAMLIKEVPFY